MQQTSLYDRLMRDPRVLSVSELTARIRSLIENRLGEVWVQGEISNFRRHSSGHWYFSLKDDAATLRCASFRMQNRLIRFAPEDGLTVRARGRLSVYEARGEYQMLVDFLEPVGVGVLQLAFEQLKARLAAEGLFDVERKRPLPLLPRRIGIVTSPSGAALRDILRILKRRNEGVSALIAPVRVQGDGAAKEISRAISCLNSIEEIDVIIVSRGGGSIEDLATFNEETVARAIYSSRVPVISAVGHETDFTIADFVSDFRASTPSAAAEIVAIAREEVFSRLARSTEALGTRIRYRFLELRHRLSKLESSPALDEVATRLHVAGQRLDDAFYSLGSCGMNAIRAGRQRHQAAAARLRDADIRKLMAERRAGALLLGARLKAATRESLDGRRERFAVIAGKLASLSPLAVLGRGYAIAFAADGRIIKRAVDVDRGDSVRVRVSEGEMDCTRN